MHYTAGLASLVLPASSSHGGPARHSRGSPRGASAREPARLVSDVMKHLYAPPQTSAGKFHWVGIIRTEKSHISLATFCQMRFQTSFISSNSLPPTWDKTMEPQNKEPKSFHWLGAPLYTTCVKAEAPSSTVPVRQWERKCSRSNGGWCMAPCPAPTPREALTWRFLNTSSNFVRITMSDRLY